MKERTLRDAEFRIGLLGESVQALLRGDIDEAKILLRDYVSATLGY